MLPSKLKLMDAKTKGYIHQKEFNFVNQIYHKDVSLLSDKQLKWLNTILSRIENQTVVVDVFAQARKHTLNPSDSCPF